MGTCILMPTNVTVETQNALAGLRKWNLVRDDSNTDFPHRVYRDNKGNIYSSVTHILNQTAPQEQKDALERWSSRPNSAVERDVACKRGHIAHAHAEYLLKTASKLARQTANRRGVWSTGGDCLERTSPKIVTWAIKKAIASAPRVAWSGSGYARGLRTFIEASVSAIHAVEFSIHYTPKNAIHGTKSAIHGFAGTCDCLIDVHKDGYSDGPYILDWKTSANERSDGMYESYKHQLGAYSLGLKALTGISPKGSIIVLSRRSGSPVVKFSNQLELLGHEQSFLERFSIYKTQLELAA